MGEIYAGTQVRTDDNSSWNVNLNESLRSDPIVVHAAWLDYEHLGIDVVSTRISGVHGYQSGFRKQLVRFGNLLP